MGRRDGRGKLNLAALVSRRGLPFLVLVAVMVTLAGCVDDTGHQFANQPPPTSGLPTSIPTWPVPTRAATPMASPLSPEQLLQTRGAAGRFYFQADGGLFTMEPRDEHVEPVFRPPEGTTIRAVASSPNGDRVAAVLVRTEDEVETADLTVLTTEGEEVYRLDRLEALAPEPRAEVVSLDWSPQGEKLLVALAPGGLVAVPLTEDAEPKLIVAGGPAARPNDAAWSPTGEEVGFLANTEEERTNLYLAGVAATPTGPEPLLPEGDVVHTVFDWAWLPDGRSLLFSEARGQTATADLWRIRSDGTDRELVASAGSVAPVARIVGAQPSRDGRAVAYVVVVPGEGGDSFDSLWVRDLATNQALRIDVPADSAVTDFWWTNAGLMFRTVPRERFAGAYMDGSYALYRVADGATATLVYRSGPGPRATPVGSPVPAASE